MFGRTVAAFFIAPLVPALLWSSISFVSNALPGGWPEFLIMTMAAYCYAAVGTAVLALPAYILLNRFNLVRWWSALSAGAILGFSFAELIGTPSSPWLRGQFPLTLIGAAAGLVFWLIIRPALPSNNRFKRSRAESSSSERGSR